jgi:hypothetical protein
LYMRRILIIILIGKLQNVCALLQYKFKFFLFFIVQGSILIQVICYFMILI